MRWLCASLSSCILSIQSRAQSRIIARSCRAYKYDSTGLFIWPLMLRFVLSCRLLQRQQTTEFEIWTSFVHKYSNSTMSEDWPCPLIYRNTAERNLSPHLHAVSQKGSLLPHSQLHMSVWLKAISSVFIHCSPRMQEWEENGCSFINQIPPRWSAIQKRLN